MPVIVGVAQITDTISPPDRARSPLGLMVEVARAAGEDSGAPALLTKVDSLVVVRMFADAVPRFKSPFGKLVNPPWSVAQRIGADRVQVGPNFRSQDEFRRRRLLHQAKRSKRNDSD